MLSAKTQITFAEIKMETEVLKSKIYSILNLVLKDNNVTSKQTDDIAEAILNEVEKEVLNEMVKVIDRKRNLEISPFDKEFGIAAHESDLNWMYDKDNPKPIIKS